MLLKVPPVKQPRDFVLCGAVCATMVLRYYGKRISFKKVVEDIATRSAKGITYTHLGSYLLRHGMSVTVQAWPDGMKNDLCSDADLKGEIAVKELQRGTKRGTKNKARIFCKELVSFARRGGTIKFKPLSLEDIRNSIERSSPVIVSIDKKYFGCSTRSTGHFIVINGVTSPESGVSEPYVYVRDPDPGYGCIGFITVRELIKGCNSWFGSVIYVNPQADS